MNSRKELNFSKSQVPCYTMGITEVLLGLCYLMHFRNLVVLIAHDEGSVKISYYVIITTNVCKVFGEWLRSSS